MTIGGKMAVKKQEQTGFDHLFFARIVEKLVGVFRKILSGDLLDFCTRWLVKLGNYSIYIAVCLAFLIGLIGAIRLSSFSFFLISIIFGVAILVVQYIAKKFSTAGETLIRNNPSQLSSSAFLDSLGLLAVLAGVISLLYFLYLAIKLPAFEPLLMGVGLFVFCELVGLIALNPSTIQVDVVKEVSAGEEAIGIATFFIKKFMRLVPIIFGLGLIIVTCMLLFDSFGLFSQAKMGIAAQKIAGIENQGDYATLILIALLPMLSYLAFVVLYLGIDVIRAILSVPGKLDNLKK